MRKGRAVRSVVGAVSRGQMTRQGRTSDAVLSMKPFKGFEGGDMI